MTGADSCTVLIVEDDRTSLAMLMEILRDKYVLLTAKDGPSAIIIAKKTQPDMILLDIVLPGMSGFEVLKALKNDQQTRGIPVIIVTGLNNRGDEETGLQLGAVDYITKPFHDSVVKLRIATHRKIIEQMYTIEKLGTIDSLTSIPNRRAFDNRLSLEWHRAVRDMTPLGIMMLDIDFFKNVNDQYGHTHGDAILKKVAEVLSQAARRSTDFCARWGGEEFMVLFPGTDIVGVEEVAEMIRSRIECEEIPHADGRITRITVSIGIHAVLPARDKDMADLVVKVDQALYQAKQTGRNKVVSS